MEEQEWNIFKEFGYINDYSKWDDIINEKTQRFHELYRVYPNILLACAATFNNIDNYLVSVHKVGYFVDRPCIFSPKGCENAGFKVICP